MNRREIQEAVEDFDENYEYEVDLYNFDHALMKIESLKNFCSGTTKNQRILHCKRIHKHLQQILKPTSPVDYDAMSNDELLERFDSIKTKEAELDKLFEYQDIYLYPWRPVFRMCKRAKTALIEKCESMMKKIGKKNKEEK
ncbi:unnamed protein product [Caenorhabditis nigoni]|uniref:Uncharacterized protein n=1 Tax=Caenorhabditis nigoni TaxID=1611254 RepID=A0A2G5UJ76_9PELO|nr:hypothetical protein B9Z55_011216 [Caenorhabditis nigoni]